MKLPRGYFYSFVHIPLTKLCNIEQAFTLQSMAIFRALFCIFEGLFTEISGAEMHPDAPDS